MNNPLLNIADIDQTSFAWTSLNNQRPVKHVEFAQNQGLEFVVENRTSDPTNPVTGQLWIRTDL